MHPALRQNLYFVREHVGAFKAANEFDILDPQSGAIVMQCREPALGFFTRLLRFTDYKRMTPFDIRVTDPTGATVVRVRRGVAWLRSHVEVLDESDRVLGGFRQRLFSLGGAFDVLNAKGEPLCTLRGKWTGWEFSFASADGQELARVTKKWAGLGRELFTSADNYVLSISDRVPAESPARQLILAAVMCIDLVLKE